MLPYVETMEVLCPTCMGEGVVEVETHPIFDPVREQWYPQQSGAICPKCNGYTTILAARCVGCGEDPTDCMCNEDQGDDDA